VGEGAVSIRLTTSLHEKRPVAVTRQAVFSRFESVSPKEMPRFFGLQRVAKKKHGVFPDLGPLLKRNALEFWI